MWKKGQKIWAGVSPPPFRALPERKHFFIGGAPLGADHQVYQQVASVYSILPEAVAPHPLWGASSSSRRDTNMSISVSPEEINLCQGQWNIIRD